MRSNVRFLIQKLHFLIQIFDCNNAIVDTNTVDRDTETVKRRQYHRGIPSLYFQLLILSIDAIYRL